MTAQFLKEYGRRILDNGYEVVGITPGTKHPNYDYSSKTLPFITGKHLSRLISNGHINDGVGVRARYSPMVDIDVLWVPLVLAVVKKTEQIIGLAPRRQGAAPKLGLIFHSSTPFKKVQSKAFTDPNGKKAQLEILGDGQQWVAYAIHPETKKRYRWLDKDYNPLTTRAEDLVDITEEKAIRLVQWFEKWCTDQGWSRWKSNSTSLTTRTAARDPDDIGGVTPLGLGATEVRDWCERLDNDEGVEYEDNFNLNPEKPNYRNVIFAIWHETDGSAEGKEIALEWSEKSPKHDEEVGRFEKLWGSADAGDMDAPITFRYVVKCVTVQEELERREKRESLLASLRSCSDVDDLKDIAKQISESNFRGLDFESLASELKKAYGRITGGSVLPIGVARSMISHKMTEDEAPDWVKPWVYIRHTGRFYSKDTGEEIEHKQFDATYSRWLNGASAVEFALNNVKIKTYYMQMYVPDEDESFWFEGMECINTFSDRLMPEIPDSYSKTDLRAIQTVESHLANILPHPRERELFTSFLAYIVQTRKRPNWAVVLQGVDGDGKSFFGEMMGAILGSKNVRKLDAQQLEDKYTAWAVGQLLSVVEELRMQGHSRYDILNKIKPYITNSSINIHPKNVNPYTALNTTAYLAFTNFKDALPLNDNDRRYLVLMSKWQTGEAIRKFEGENPGYFDTLFKTLNQRGALRKWLTEYELHADFLPTGRAPLTEARDEMVNLNKSDTQLALEEVIQDDNHPQVSRDLIVSGALVRLLYDETEETLKTFSVAKLLMDAGYTRLQFRQRVDKGSDIKESIWVREKSRFQGRDLSSQRKAVMRFIHKRIRINEI